jgi:hypothetical protein
MLEAFELLSVDRHGLCFQTLVYFLFDANANKFAIKAQGYKNN